MVKTIMVFIGLKMLEIAAILGAIAIFIDICIGINCLIILYWSVENIFRLLGYGVLFGLLGVYGCVILYGFWQWLKTNWQWAKRIVNNED